MTQALTTETLSSRDAQAGVGDGTSYPGHPAYHLVRDKFATQRTYRVCLDPGDEREHIVAGIVRRCDLCRDGSWEARFSAWNYWVPTVTKAEGVAYVLRTWMQTIGAPDGETELERYERELAEVGQ